MTKEIEEMNKAVRSLALELPEQVYNSFHAAWERFRFRMLTPIPQPADVQERAKEYLIPKYFISEPTIEEEVKEYEELKAAYLAGASSVSGMQWVKVLARLKLIVRDLETERDSDKDERNKWYAEGLKKAVIIVKCHISDMEKFPIESSPSSMQEENERLVLKIQQLENEKGKK